MPEPKIIIKSKMASMDQLPDSIVLPDAKKPVRMGSGTITSLISSGGMAIIYEIWNAELEVKRAIKLLHPDHTKESEERFMTEMKITAKLHHPNIVEIYSVGKWNELPYIEMERIDGFTLEKLIADSGGLPVEVSTAIGIMTGRALNYAHNQDYQLYGKEYHGIIHRDLKPGNIMVTKDGIVKLMDFGIAKPVTVSMHTMEGVIMGTMQYLAPEQLDGKDIDVRADIYSLGAVTYEMLTGSRAFPEQNLAKLVTDKLNNNYVPLDSFSRKIPPPLCNLMHKCLRYEKEKRMQNALEFLRALGHVHKSITAQSPEQILSQYMKEAHHGRTLISIRKKTHFSPVVVWLLAMVPLAGTVLFAFWIYLHYVHKNQPAVVAANKSPVASTMPSAPAFASVAPQPIVQPPRMPQTTPDEVTDRPEKKQDEVKDVFGPVARHTTKHGRLRGEIKSRPEHSSPVSAKIIAPEAPTGPISQTAALKENFPDNKPVEKKGNLLNKLKQQFKTSDVMLIFSNEVENGHFQNALTVYESLPQDDADTKKARIYRLRTLKGLGDKAGVSNLLAQDIYDGEFYLEKAMDCFDRRDLARTQDFLKKASISPCGFLDARVFRQTLLYSIALCASAVYDEQSSQETKNKAMEAWYDVKSLFRTSPDHEYFKKADSEIRRLSKSAVVVK
jgi:Protein kinase domain